MADPVAVLVVPAEGDPGGLLASGLLGAEPPRVVQSVAPVDEGTWREDDRDAWGRMAESALPLWWDGALVPEGWDRAKRCIDRDRVSGWGWHSPPMPDLLRVAVGAVDTGIASRVALLDRVDGRLVERAP